MGATGLVGTALTKLLCTSTEYERVNILTRKKGLYTHPKVKEIHLNDSWESIEADHVFCCIGTTIKKAGSQEAFEAVDYELPIKLAHWVLAHKSDFMGIITAMGAKPTSPFFYNRVKGKVEKDIAELGLKSVKIFRPSIIIGERSESRLFEKWAQVLMQKIDWIIPPKYKAVSAEEIAKCMYIAAQRPDKGVVILENDQIKKASLEA